MQKEERILSASDVRTFLRSRTLGKPIVCAFVINGRKSVWAGIPTGGQHVMVQWKWHTIINGPRRKCDWAVFIDEDGELDSLLSPLPPEDDSICITDISTMEERDLPEWSLTSPTAADLTESDDDVEQLDFFIERRAAPRGMPPPPKRTRLKGFGTPLAHHAQGILRIRGRAWRGEYEARPVSHVPVQR